MTRPVCLNTNVPGRAEKVPVGVSAETDPRGDGEGGWVMVQKTEWNYTPPLNAVGAHRCRTSDVAEPSRPTQEISAVALLKHESRQLPNNYAAAGQS